MSKSTAHANEWNALVYNATAIANLADNTATAPLTNIFIAAHTADPGAAGTQSTSEAAYTGYARSSVARTTGGFTTASGVLSLVADASFGACTAGTSTLTHWSTGVAVSGATKILDRGVFGSRQGPFTAVVSGNAITVPGHTMIVNDRVCFYQTSGSTLPGGVTDGLVYFVITVTGDVITVSLTQGGASITLSSAGDGLAFRVNATAVGAGTTPKLAAGVISVVE
jgi:hypothetical protein